MSRQARHPSTSRPAIEPTSAQPSWRPPRQLRAVDHRHSGSRAVEWGVVAPGRAAARPSSTSSVWLTLPDRRFVPVSEHPRCCRSAVGYIEPSSAIAWNIALPARRGCDGAHRGTGTTTAEPRRCVEGRGRARWIQTGRQYARTTDARIRALLAAPRPHLTSCPYGGIRWQRRWPAPSGVPRRDGEGVALGGGEPGHGCRRRC